MPKFELVEIITKDKLVHQGVYFSPSKPGKKAILWAHGLTGKFYGDIRFLNLVSEACEARGIGFAAFNNRGHDMLASGKRRKNHTGVDYEYVTLGSSVENFEECVLDIEAGIDFLVAKGYSDIVIAGHSTGANKVCFYAGTTDNPHVTGIILAGPMSDRYSATDSATNAKYQKEMEQKISEGKGDVLLEGYDFLPLTPKRWMSLLAQGSPEDTFNYRDSENALSAFSRIRKPLLVAFGQNDEHADRPILEIKSAFDEKSQSKQYKSVIISEADHGYTGKEKEFVDTILSWVGGL